MSTYSGYIDNTEQLSLNPQECHNADTSKKKTFQTNDQ